MSIDSTNVGWCSVVAPTSETLRTTDAQDFNTTPLGIIPKLPGRGHASYEVAPTLCNIIRQILEGKQISPENISLYLAKVKKHHSYDKAFRTFWAFSKDQGIHLPNSSMEELGLQLQKFNGLAPQLARYAYSAILLIPGYDLTIVRCCAF